MGRSDTGVVAGEFSLSSSSSNTMGFSNDPLSPISKSLKAVAEKGVSILSIPSLKTASNYIGGFFPRRIQCPPGLTTHNRCYSYPDFQHWQESRPHFKCSLLVGSDWDLGKMIVQKFLSLGQQQVPSWQRKFLRACCHFLDEIFYSQKNRVWTIVETPLDSLVGNCEDHAACM